MRASIRPYATAGVALVGAGVMAVSPVIVPPAQPEVRSVESAVELTATTSLAYVPINLIHAVINAPGNFIFGVEQFAAAMAASGSWNDSHPMNVWGWDDANPAHAWSLMNMAVPFPALSRPLGKHLNWWMTANLPMHEGCDFTCPDLRGMLGKMFKVPMSRFYSEEGYTFPEVINPVGGWETDWSKKTVKLDPLEPVKSVWNYLVSKPEKIHIPSIYEMITAFANLARALQITGHLPKFFAVDEIETFFKLFVRKPKEVAEIPPVNPDDPAYNPAPEAEEPEGEPDEAAAARVAGQPEGQVEVAETRTFTLTVDTGVPADATASDEAAAPETPPAPAPAVTEDTTEETTEEAAEEELTVEIPEPVEEAKESTPKQQSGGKHRRVDDSERRWGRTVERVESGLSKVADAFTRSTGSSDTGDSSSSGSARSSSEAAA
ncbi:hypothetical protein ACAG25_13260 [Mycobacterium sp. pV006]|uniref:hypothetical protein n=1 Tax=Mycobacterium sp. pV006 TaxID=3238983 RepID=UPI00351BD414